MSDGRSEDRDQPGGTSGRKAPAASDLLAMWVTGKTPDDEPAEAADRAEPAAADVPEEEAYAESLWPGDEPPAAGDSPEPVGGEQWWPYAEPDGSLDEAADTAAPATSPSDDRPSEASVEPPASLGPRGQDMSTTESWTLDDFERYVRNQKDNELADWIGGERAADEPGAPAEPDDAFSPAPADAPAAPEPEAPRLTSVPDAVEGQVEDDDDEDDPDAVDPLAGPEVEVEWNPPEGEAPAVEHSPEPDPEPEPWADWSTAPAVEEPVTEPDPGQVPLFDDAAVPGPAEQPEESPAPVEDVWPEPPVQPAAEPDPEPDPAPEPRSYDLQEWYDDYGLRWVSGDGGYTWYSDDGQGWDAEHSEVIPVAAGFVPFPGDPRSPGYTALTAASAPVEPAVEPAAEPDVEPDEQVAEAPEAPEVVGPPVEPEPEPTVASEPEEDLDDWPEPAGSTAHHYAGLADDTRWPEETGPQPRVDPAPSTQVMAPVSAPPESPAESPAARAEPQEAPAYNLYADQPAASRRDTVAAEEQESSYDEASFPEHVEYKPRGAYRPLLIILFVAAAVVAVAAIFWAISKGSQAATGIAAGVTGFALAFWWGLLSWTPTVVSIDGPMLEVSRGSDGERFDLRSPRLDIQVDDDVYSRSWRTTIVRPNGTELVIPSSAVDAEEFSRIVAHHRAEVSR